MIIERTDSEILIRLPLDSKVFDSQDILDFIKYKEIVTNSKADDYDIEQISKFVTAEIHQSFTNSVRH